MGSGNSPRSLSPLTDIWRPASPVECRWLSVSRRCTGLHGRLQIHFGPAAEPAVGVTTVGFWVRLLGPECARLPACFSRTRSDFSEMKCVLTISARSASRLLITIVCPAPRVLSLTPQVAFRSRSDDPVFGASRSSDLIASPRSSPAIQRLLIGSLNPR
jgi:hypothetical protein